MGSSSLGSFPTVINAVFAIHIVEEIIILRAAGQFLINQQLKVSEILSIWDFVPSNTKQAREQKKATVNYSFNNSSANTYSGIPSGGNTSERMLSISLYFNIRSLTVVLVSDGDAFTSTNHAFKLLSMIMS